TSPWTGRPSPSTTGGPTQRPTPYQNVTIGTFWYTQTPMPSPSPPPRPYQNVTIGTFWYTQTPMPSPSPPPTPYQNVTIGTFWYTRLRALIPGSHGMVQGVRTPRQPLRCRRSPSPRRWARESGRDRVAARSPGWSSSGTG